MDWFTWRVVRDERIPDGLMAVRRDWTFVNLLEAHMFLDAANDLFEIDEAEREHNRGKR